LGPASQRRIEAIVISANLLLAKESVTCVLS